MGVLEPHGRGGSIFRQIWVRRPASAQADAPSGDPVLLLMDEPFTALDVPTAETLRTDFLDLWIEHQLPTKAVLMVTHNIEEAVLMCDRILVLVSNPGDIAAAPGFDQSHRRVRRNPGLASLQRTCRTGRHRPSARPRNQRHVSDCRGIAHSGVCGTQERRDQADHCGSRLRAEQHRGSASASSESI
jgi:ABC-type multidrug transport system ATPase subunit